MTSAATVRPADVTDADAIFALLSRFATSYPADRAAFDRHFEILLAKMTYDGTDFLVAELGDRVVGYALASRSLVLYANGTVAQVHELMVAEEHRNRGIGGQLLAGITERARTAGAVELTVPTRRAQEFYLRHGFAETATFLKKELN